MTSITATGNNFGAGDIRFQAFIEENYLILNSEVSFDPSNAQYQPFLSWKSMSRICLSGRVPSPVC